MREEYESEFKFIPKETEEKNLKHKDTNFLLEIAYQLKRIADKLEAGLSIIK